MKKIKINLRLGILLVLLFLSISAWSVYVLMPDKNFLEIDWPTGVSHPKYFSQLTGQVVTSTEAQVPSIVAVMIDNFPDVYPQSCLGRGMGEVVYEAPVEGVTTRFMQVMNSTADLPKVGPVRSARAYYLDWLAEYGDDALYMHCGGAPEALVLIKNRKIFDANEFYWGPYYWRDQKKTAPHNLFTSREKWESLLSKYGGKENKTTWSGWKFSDDIIEENIGESVKEISIKYYPGYKVTWKFDLVSLDSSPPFHIPYTRLVNGGVHMSICGENTSAIQAYNILVQFVEMETIDEVGRKEVKTIGEGDAYVLHYGRLIRGRWKKENLASRTRFYDSKNEEIKLVSGSTWVQIVPVGTVVEITN